jgi:hypothetical protein
MSTLLDKTKHSVKDMSTQLDKCENTELKTCQHNLTNSKTQRLSYVNMV